jgi:hypothetical protein
MIFVQNKFDLVTHTTLPWFTQYTEITETLHERTTIVNSARPNT